MSRCGRNVNSAGTLAHLIITLICNICSWGWAKARLEASRRRLWVWPCAYKTFKELTLCARYQNILHLMAASLPGCLMSAGTQLPLVRASCQDVQDAVAAAGAAQCPHDFVWSNFCWHQVNNLRQRWWWRRLGADDDAKVRGSSRSSRRSSSSSSPCQDAAELCSVRCT